MSIVLWAQEAIFTHVIVDWDRFMQVMYLGRASRTKETLPDFLKWCQVTRHPLVFCGLTGSQRTPGKWGVTCSLSGTIKTRAELSLIFNFLECILTQVIHLEFALFPSKQNRSASC